MSDQHIMRFGQVIGIHAERIADYRQLHDGPGVRDLLRAANIRHFSIFLTELGDGRFYEFAYFEYVGDDYAADMAALDVHPRNQEWLALCGPMQIPLPGDTSWRRMDIIFYNA